MQLVFPEAILIAALAIFLFLILLGALVLIVISMRRPRTLPLAVAGGLVVFALTIVAISPYNVPTIVGLLLAFIGIALGVSGGDPVTRRVLDLAAGGRVHETDDGGILVRAAGADASASSDETTTVLRGGTTIGYLERITAVLSIVAGYPEAIAVIVAIKGIGRFSELTAAEARERFIIGTLSSLLWACVVGALVRLAIF